MSAQPPQPPQSDYQRHAQEALAQVRAASQAALKTFLNLIYNPVGALPGAFQALPGNAALGVGVVFIVAYALLAAIGGQLILGAIMGAFTGGLGGPGFQFGAFLKGILWGVIFGGGVALGCFAVRKIFNAAGSIAGDLLLAGAALLPLGIGLFAGGVLGKIIPVLGVILLVIGFSLAILVLFTGFTRVAHVKEGPASYLSALALIIGGAVVWLLGKLLG